MARASGGCKYYAPAKLGGAQIEKIHLQLGTQFFVMR